MALHMHGRPGVCHVHVPNPMQPNCNVRLAAAPGLLAADDPCRLRGVPLIAATWTVELPQNKHGAGLHLEHHTSNARQHVVLITTLTSPARRQPVHLPSTTMSEQMLEQVREAAEGQIVSVRFANRWHGN